MHSQLWQKQASSFDEASRKKKNILYHLLPVRRWRNHCRANSSRSWHLFGLFRPCSGRRRRCGRLATTRREHFHRMDRCARSLEGGGRQRDSTESSKVELVRFHFKLRSHKRSEVGENASGNFQSSRHGSHLVRQQKRLIPLVVVKLKELQVLWLLSLAFSPTKMPWTMQM